MWKHVETKKNAWQNMLKEEKGWNILESKKIVNLGS